MAIDIQKKMLAALGRRAAKNGVSETVTAHLGNSGSIVYDEKAHFILLFWMLHEVSDQRALLIEIRDLLKTGGYLFFVEPIIHVPGKSFLRTIRTATELGFTLKQNPKIRFSHSALLGLVENNCP